MNPRCSNSSLSSSSLSSRNNNNNNNNHNNNNNNNNNIHGEGPSRLPVFNWRNRRDFGEHDAQGLVAATAAGQQYGSEDDSDGSDEEGEKEEGVVNALIILNTDCVGGGLFYKFWAHASVRICADGGANRLYDGLGGEEREQFLPSAIKGDLDSVRPEVVAWYKAKGCRVVKNGDVDTNDLEKCLELLKHTGEGGNDQRQQQQQQQQQELPPWERKQHPTRQSLRTNVFVLGALGQRFDHAMASCHLLYRYAGVFKRLVLLGNESVAFLLPEGRNWVEPDGRMEGPLCGLIPLGRQCREIRTRGLKWDLRGESMEFGGLVSTSNEVVGERREDGREGVWIETSDPVIWTMALKEEWRKDFLHV
ncbi:thiamin pyrophosphokinase 1 [Nannochloropsis oceanica]